MRRSQLRLALLVTVVLLTGMLGYLGYQADTAVGVGPEPYDAYEFSIAVLWAWWLVVPQAASLLVNGRLPTRRLKQPYLGPRNHASSEVLGLKPGAPSLN